MEYKIEKIYKNCLNMIKLLNIDINIDKNNTSNFTETEYLLSLSINFLTNFLSNFKYCCSVKSTKFDNSLNELINESLELLNSKFILPIPDSSDSSNTKFTKIEFINFILYIFIEYDYVNDYIQFLAGINKKHINVSFDNLINADLLSDINMSNSNSSNILNTSNTLNTSNSPSAIESFRKFTFNLNNLKKQIDNLVNLSYKLNEIKVGQPKPIK